MGSGATSNFMRGEGRTGSIFFQKEITVFKIWSKKQHLLIVEGFCLRLYQILKLFMFCSSA